MCDAMGKCVGLARTGTGDYQKRACHLPYAVFHCHALLGIQFFQIGSAHMIPKGSLANQLRTESERNIVEIGWEDQP